MFTAQNPENGGSQCPTFQLLVPNFPVGEPFSGWEIPDFPLGKSHLSAAGLRGLSARIPMFVVNPLNEIAVFHETSLKELSLISFNLVEITIFCYQFCSNLLCLLTSKGTRNNHFPSLSDEQMSHYLGVVEHQRVFHAIFAKTFQ